MLKTSQHKKPHTAKCTNAEVSSVRIHNNTHHACYNHIDTNTRWIKVTSAKRSPLSHTHATLVFYYDCHCWECFFFCMRGRKSSTIVLCRANFWSVNCCSFGAPFWRGLRSDSLHLIMFSSSSLFPTEFISGAKRQCAGWLFMMIAASLLINLQFRGAFIDGGYFWIPATKLYCWSAVFVLWRFECDIKFLVARALAFPSVVSIITN